MGADARVQPLTAVQRDTVLPSAQLVPTWPAEQLFSQPHTATGKAPVQRCPSGQPEVPATKRHPASSDAQVTTSASLPQTWPAPVHPAGAGLPGQLAIGGAP